MTVRDIGLRKSAFPKGRFTWWPASSSAAKRLEAYEAQLLMVAGDVSRVRASADVAASERVEVRIKKIINTPLAFQKSWFILLGNGRSKISRA